jgi:hypothetical protein
MNHQGTKAQRKKIRILFSTQIVQLEPSRASTGHFHGSTLRT